MHFFSIISTSNDNWKFLVDCNHGQWQLEISIISMSTKILSWHLEFIIVNHVKFSIYHESTIPKYKLLAEGTWVVFHWHLEHFPSCKCQRLEAYTLYQHFCTAIQLLIKGCQHNDWTLDHLVMEAILSCLDQLF